MVILTVALTLYGATAFQVDQVPMGVKTLSGRELQKDSLQASPWSPGSCVCHPHSSGNVHSVLLTGAAL